MLISSDWKPIEGFPSYRVTRHGAVVSLKGRTPRALRLERHTTGYLRVTLSEDARKTNRYVHQLVAEAYHGSRPEGMEIRHLDGNPHNNRADNLTWGTHSENQRDRHRHGTGRNQWGPWRAVSA